VAKAASQDLDLAFAMQYQQQTNWCWAAVSTSTALYYGAASPWTQCSLANAQLGQSGCCTDGSTSACNQAWYLDRALTQVGHFQSWQRSAATFAQVQAAIGASQPIGVRIGWSSGGHFVAIRGYHAVQQTLDVEDPWYGPSQVTYSTFCSSYLGAGTWTDSYFTQ
jgi:hypothetical protein